MSQQPTDLVEVLDSGGGGIHDHESCCCWSGCTRQRGVHGRSGFRNAEWIAASGPDHGSARARRAGALGVQRLGPLLASSKLVRRLWLLPAASVRGLAPLASLAPLAPLVLRGRRPPSFRQSPA